LPAATGDEGTLSLDGIDGEGWDWLAEPGADGAFGSDSLEQFVDARIDDLFGALSGEGEDTGPTASDDEGSAGELEQPESPEMREMFDGIAAVYIRPVRQFVARLELGPVSAEWLEMCVPAVEMVSRSAHSMGLRSLAPSLEEFGSLLRQAAAGNARAVEGATREAILRAHADLADVLPQAFVSEQGGDQRDSVILYSLLRQIPEVGRVSLDKVFSAGLTSIDMLERASAQELTQTAGVPLHLSGRICEIVQRYQAESRARQASVLGPSDWLVLLEPHLARLAEHHGAYLETPSQEEDSQEDAASRRRHRRGRQDAALKIDVLLAEMGEAKLVDELQRLTFADRIQRLRELGATLRPGAADWVSEGTEGVAHG
jgi:hypothetical protein